MKSEKKSVPGNLRFAQNLMVFKRKRNCGLQLTRSRMSSVTRMPETYLTEVMVLVEERKRSLDAMTHRACCAQTGGRRCAESSLVRARRGRGWRGGRSARTEGQAEEKSIRRLRRSFTKLHVAALTSIPLYTSLTTGTNASSIVCNERKLA